MSKEKKVKVETADYFKSRPVIQLDDEWLKKECPTLWDLLRPRYVDGKCTRQAGRVSVRPDGSLWRWVLELPTEENQTIGYVETLDDFFLRLECHVSDSKCVWTKTYAKIKRELPIVDE